MRNEPITTFITKMTFTISQGKVVTFSCYTCQIPSKFLYQKLLKSADL